MVAKVLSSKPAQLAGAALAALSAVPMIGHFVAPNALAECNPYDPEDRPNVAVNGQSWWERFSSGYNIPMSTKANIEVRDVYVTPSPSSNFAYAYVMLANADARWAQVGWWEWPGNDRLTMVQWWPPNATDFSWSLEDAEPVGTSPQYRVDFSPGGPDAFIFFVNGAQVHVGAAGFAPTVAFQSGEINRKSTQLPGGYNAKERFTNAKIRWASESYYTDFAGEPKKSHSYFGNDKISTTELQIWDTACAT